MVPEGVEVVLSDVPRLSVACDEVSCTKQKSRGSITTDNHLRVVLRHSSCVASHNDVRQEQPKHRDQKTEAWRRGVADPTTREVRESALEYHRQGSRISTPPPNTLQPARGHTCKPRSSASSACRRVTFASHLALSRERAWASASNRPRQRCPRGG